MDNWLGSEMVNGGFRSYFLYMHRHRSNLSNNGRGYNLSMLSLSYFECLFLRSKSFGSLQKLLLCHQLLCVGLFKCPFLILILQHNLEGSLCGFLCVLGILILLSFSNDSQLLLQVLLFLLFLCDQELLVGQMCFVQSISCGFFSCLGQVLVIEGFFQGLALLLSQEFSSLGSF